MLKANGGTVQHAADKAKAAAGTFTPMTTRLEDPDEVTLARKVETEIFRAPDAPKDLLHEPGTPAPDAPPRGLVHERTDQPTRRLEWWSAPADASSSPGAR